jgi:hypothetical protein
MNRRSFIARMAMAATAGTVLAGRSPGVFASSAVVGEWSTISKNTVSDVPLPFQPEGNRVNFMKAWSGAIWDAAGRRMLAFGGGHHDYAGNEVMAFSPDSGLWSLLMPPTPAPPAITAGPAAYPDGSPASRHSYSGITYVPWVGAGGGMFVYSGSHWSLGGWGNPGTDTWMLDIAAKAWTRLADAPAGYVAAMATCDPSARNIWIVSSDGKLCRYDSERNRWTVASTFQNGSDAGATFVYHPVTKRLYAAGNTTFNPPKTFDATSRWPGLSNFPITGPNMSKGGPVLVADPTAPVLYTVDQGVVWQIDARSGKGVALATGGVTPTAENGQGTFGRGQLDPKTRRLLLVNRIDEPVFAYQLPEAPR